MKTVKWQLANYRHADGVMKYGPVWEWPEPLFKVVQKIAWRNERVFKAGYARNTNLETCNWLDAPEEEHVANVVAEYVIKNRAKLIASAQRRKATAMQRVKELQEEEDMFTPIAVIAPFPEEVAKVAT